MVGYALVHALNYVFIQIALFSFFNLNSSLNCAKYPAQKASLQRHSCKIMNIKDNL